MGSPFLNAFLCIRRAFPVPSLLFLNNLPTTSARPDLIHRHIHTTKLTNTSKHSRTYTNPNPHTQPLKQPYRMGNFISADNPMDKDACSGRNITFHYIANNGTLPPDYASCPYAEKILWAHHCEKGVVSFSFLSSHPSSLFPFLRFSLSFPFRPSFFALVPSKMLWIAKANGL